MTLSTLTRPLALAFALIGTMTLAACGGGGGGSSAVPGGGGSTTHAALKAGFSGVGRGGSALARRPLALSGTLVPVADFILADSYVTPGSVLTIPSAVAVAFYDPAAGTVPNPVPTITWTQSGLSATLSAPSVPVTISGVSIAGETSIAIPAAAGTGTLIGTASNSDVATLTFFAYRGAGIATDGSSGLSPCVSFASGTSTPGTTGDLCIVASGGATSVSAPLGGLLVTKPIDQVTAADAATLPTTATTIPTTSIVAGAGTYTIIAHTAAGALVKWGVAETKGPGFVANAYGPYRIAVGGAFDF